MDCKINPEELIDFHFGNLDEEARTRVEAHLSSCSACLQDYFLLKRDAESAPPVTLRPSQAVKHRIMQDFAVFSHGRWRPTRSAQLICGGLIAAAAAAAAAIFLLVSHQTVAPKTETLPKAEMVHSLDETVDSAGSAPGHINII